MTKADLLREQSKLLMEVHFLAQKRSQNERSNNADTTKNSCIVQALNNIKNSNSN